MPTSSPFNRVLLIVLDGAGIGAMPDAPDWGDAGADTFGHILESRKVRLPNLQRYGLGNIRPLASVPALDQLSAPSRLTRMGFLRQ
jgi:phosphopentomutase